MNQIEPQDPREGQTVSDLVLSLIIGQVIQGLQDEDFEHQHGITVGATAMTPLGAAKHSFQGRTKFRPRHMGGERFQGIPVVTQALMASGKVKKMSWPGVGMSMSSPPWTRSIAKAAQIVRGIVEMPY